MNGALARGRTLAGPIQTPATHRVFCLDRCPTICTTWCLSLPLFCLSSIRFRLLTTLLLPPRLFNTRCVPLRPARGTCARKRQRKAAWAARPGAARPDAPPATAHAARTAAGGRVPPAAVSAPGGSLQSPCGPEQLRPAPQRTAWTTDSECDTEEIQFEGCAGVAIVDVVTMRVPVAREVPFRSAEAA